MFYQCKMCGGTLDIKNNDTVGICEYCGTKQTLPRLDNDKKANLYDRAAHFRQLNDYDKAMLLYEQVLAEDKTDAEAYWSIVLCRYGIEYVEDPATHKRIPTVNRAQYTSIFNDSDYKQAIQYADPFQSELYEQEAKAIDDIQKGILKISKNEKPFDIFICYKESDDNGRRTIDSVLAYDVYKELVGAGYKVFFSRVTLEDKIGTAYEPYIFAALNSAPIMLVIGTKKEHFNAVWVKNEWSRFLGMIKSGAKKTLIPMYKDMSPYDLPEEFVHLQAQDMNNLGFMQDLLRGLNKLISNNQYSSGKVTTSDMHVNKRSEEIKNLTSRADIALDNQQWKEANGYFEKTLDIDPEYALAYVGKLMSEMKVSELDELKLLDFDIEKNNNFKSAVRFADEGLKSQLNSVKNTINNIRYQKNLNRKKRIKLCVIVGIVLVTVCTIGFIGYRMIIVPKKTYEKACVFMNDADYTRAIEMFSNLGNYKDSIEKKKECTDSLEYKNALKNAKQGDIIKYGNYNGNTDWIVLVKESNRILVLSKTGLCEKQWDETDNLVDWKTCTIRNWLNDAYLDDAFSDEEMNRIEYTEISYPDYTEDNKVRFSSSSKVVADRIFLLSRDEVGKYLPEKESRIFDGKAWWLATNNTSYVKSSYDKRKKLEVYYIRENGTFLKTEQHSRGIFVRPAMWIDISNI